MSKDIENTDSNKDETIVEEAPVVTNESVNTEDGAPPKSMEPEEDIQEHRTRHSHRDEPPRRWGTWVLIAAIVILAIGGAYAAYRINLEMKYNNVLNIDTFYEGVHVDGIPIGGMTMEQAKKALEDSQTARNEKVGVTLLWDDDQVRFGCKDVDISYDTKERLEEAWQIGREGSKKERYEKVLSLVDNPMKLETKMTVDPSGLETRVRNFANFREKAVGEPAVKFNPDPKKPQSEWFDYTTPEVGIETDDDALWDSVLGEFDNQTYGKVSVVKNEIVPDISLADMQNITQRIVQFKTVMARNPNREHNVTLACSMINGTVLMPGEEFSMNNTTGERTKEKGFKEANIILGGNQLVPGVAGGVCQVSGTLFNAAAMADLEITERHHHSFELSYLKRGRDATVNYGTADLKFVNNKDYPIYISMYTVERDVYAAIFGPPIPDDGSISLWVKTTEEIPSGGPVYVKDSEVPAGSEPVKVKGHTGIRCTTYKIYKDKDGDTIKTVELFKDFYRPYDEELHVNPADYEAYKNQGPPASP